MTKFEKKLQIKKKISKQKNSELNPKTWSADEKKGRFYLFLSHPRG